MTSTQILLVSKQECALDLPWFGADDQPGETHDWKIETATNGWEALARVHGARGPDPDLVLLDLMPSESDGLHTLRWLRRVRPDMPVLVLADDSSHRLEALRLGAQDFLIRPWQPRQLEIAVRRSLFNFADGPEEVIADEIEQIGGDMFFVAASPTMRKLRAQAELLAQVNAPVFILGELGSGKDLAACLIHKLSVRSGFRFLKLNCAALPGDVLDSELFAESNANGRNKPSKLELCHRGTLFLDEITEMPMSLQAKLLGVLRDGYFGQHDGNSRTELDVRILAATQANVKQAIADRKLREDLYYRLSEFTVHVPALRQRKEEIPLLLGYFMNKLARRYNLPSRIFSSAALEACQRYSWPGNLRELEKFVKRYLVMGDEVASARDMDMNVEMVAGNSYQPYGSQISSSQISSSMFESAGPRPAISGLKSLVQSVKGEAERNAIAGALEQARWNRKAAAKLLNVSYRTLLYKIEQYHMSPPASDLNGGKNGHGEPYRERNLNKG
jgi:two-component system, NtrC family, response regulator AtoC